MVLCWLNTDTHTHTEGGREGREGREREREKERDLLYPCMLFLIAVKAVTKN